jgi:hypothetical protein
MISRLLRYEALTLKRNSNEGTYGNDGFPMSPYWVTSTIRGNVQPLTGHQRLQLPEGERAQDQMWLFTSDTVEIDDIVVRNEIQYEVKTVEDWRQQRLSHLRCRMVRKDV